MQSTELKRFTIHRIGFVAVAIGALAAGLISIGTPVDLTGDSDGHASSESRTIQRPSPAYSAQFLEWNTNLPGVSAEPLRGTSANDPLELNMTPSGTTRHAAIGYAEMLFLEANTSMPDTAAPAILSFDQMRFMEANELPGDDAPGVPMPDGSQTPNAMMDY